MDPAPFAAVDFDPHARARLLRADDAANPIAALSTAISDIGKLTRSLVAAHYDALLDNAAHVSDLTQHLSAVRLGLNSVDTDLEKVRVKVHVPYATIQRDVLRLHRLRQASDALRRSSRFILLARRLEFQVSQLSVPPAASDGQATVSLQDAGRESAISKAALTIAELDALLDRQEVDGDAIPIRYIHIVADHIPAIDGARGKVTSEMQSLLVSGLADSSQSRIASALQTAHNLKILPKLIQSLVQDLTDAVQSRIRAAFDISKLSNEVAAKEPAPSVLYKSRVRTEPTNLNAPQWTSTLWSRLESLIDELAGCCLKVYILEKVLRIKKDITTDVPFLDEAMRALDNKPSAIFWSVTARSLEERAREAVKGSTFLQQTFAQGYPRLLRLFHDFFSRIALHTDTIYSEAQQSPETILVLRALSPLEALYLSRSTNKLNEVVAQSLSGGAKSPPSMGEALAIARTVINELDSSRFDPILARNVAKNVAGVLDSFVSRIDALVVKDRIATAFVGTMINPQQILNAQLATTSYQCWVRLKKMQDELHDAVANVISSPIKRLHSLFLQISTPVLTSLRRELSAIISRLHRIDLGSRADDAPPSLGGASIYIRELAEKLAFVKNDVLAKFNVGDYNREWLLSIGKGVTRTFVLHASIAKPLGERGKLQLTSDMTELEFALSAFLSDSAQSKTGLKLDSLGDDFKTLRSLRPMLFLDNASLGDPAKTAGVPKQVVLHHILVRSPLQLPHALHGWQEAEYVAWLDEHSPEDGLSLVEGDLTHWIKMHEGGDTTEAREYIDLCRRVLDSN